MVLPTTKLWDYMIRDPSGLSPGRPQLVFEGTQSRKF